MKNSASDSYTYDIHELQSCWINKGAEGAEAKRENVKLRYVARHSVFRKTFDDHFHPIGTHLKVDEIGGTAQWVTLRTLKPHEYQHKHIVSFGASVEYRSPGKAKTEPPMALSQTAKLTDEWNHLSRGPYQTRTNDMVAECITRLLNSMVPAKEDTVASYCQPLEAYRGKQCISKGDVSNYGFQGVCIGKNVVKPTFLTGFFTGDLEKHKSVELLTIEPTSMHFDFNMVTGLGTRL